MAKLIGSIDERGRPLVRVKAKGSSEEFLAVVDTGFNGDLMMSTTAARTLNVAISKVLERVELGTGQVEEVQNGNLSIDWLGETRSVRVLISLNWPRQGPDEPTALIGTRLLRPHLLMIDFGAETLEIEAQA